jgi:hypothetical protein
MEMFVQADVDTLAVYVAGSPTRVVGIITYQFLMKRYHELLDRR